jgi:hypothetical protein
MTARTGKSLANATSAELLEQLARTAAREATLKSGTNRLYDHTDAIVEALTARLQEHENKEFEVWDRSQKFQESVGQSIITLNHEMGGVQGRLDGIADKMALIIWFVGGTTLLLFAAAIKTFFFGGI